MARPVLPLDRHCQPSRVNRTARVLACDGPPTPRIYLFSEPPNLECSVLGPTAGLITMNIGQIRTTQQFARPGLCAMHEKSEWELIADSRNGNGDAMSELFRRHYPSSVRVARGFLPSEDECLDSVQSAYLSAFRNFDSFRGAASFKTWITRIVMNQCLMQLRQATRHRLLMSLDDSTHGEFPLPAPDRGYNPEDLAFTAEIGKALTDAAARLPKHLRDVFNRCSISGLTMEEAAQALGLTVAGTKTRLCRARSRLRRELRAFRKNAGVPYRAAVSPVM
jgi:RNA polymerase sigma-70 factor, ECF subfamily